MSINTDKELFSLIFKWQSEPAKYTSLLVEQIYLELKGLCITETANPDNQKLKIPVSASSLVNEVYIKLENGYRECEITSVRSFYAILRKTIQRVLIDRHRQINCAKRTLDKGSNTPEIKGYEAIMKPSENFSEKVDVEMLVEYIDKVSSVDPEAGEALSFKYFTAKSVKQIAQIMNMSTSTIDIYLTQGKKIMKAVAVRTAA